MLRLKATKTSLYKLAAEYATLPGIRRTSFHKVSRRTDFFLQWNEEERDLTCTAFLTACAGRPRLQITMRDITGQYIDGQTHILAIQDLRVRGMVEEFTTAAERRRLERGADNGGLSPAT